MKNLKLAIILCSVLLITTGYVDRKPDSQAPTHSNQQEITSDRVGEIPGRKITVQKCSQEDNVCEDFKEIIDTKEVNTAMGIVESADWQNAKVEMSRYADYQFPLKNGSQDKIVSYLLWVTPNGENVEIVADTNTYVKLPKVDFATLYEILTGRAIGLE